MKIRYILLSLLAFHAISNTFSQATKPFALIELYTSQGCSSCPRADQYLSEVISGAEKTGQKIIALSFHVDYWNRLGWKDPYSSPANTQRQYSYARSLQSSNVYTPQIVVNGKFEFVGSDRRKGEAAITKVLEEQPGKSINLSSKQASGQTMEVSYEIKGGDMSESVLNIAIVERDISTAIGRGENRGRTLQHDNVVRVFISLSANDNSGKTSLKIPDDLITENSSIVAFIQKKGLKEVEAAEILPLM